MEERQLINIARPTTTSSSAASHCTPFTLPSAGVLTLNSSTIFTLSEDAVFQPECTGTSDTILIGTGSPTYQDFRDPFYASTLPECYALAATTVIAYMLVIMLLITPRTFLHQGAVVLGRRGFTNGPSGSDAGIGIGGRPWLQKVAALTVAISLTIATADTFKVAEKQYQIGYMDAQALQNEVENGTELKVIRTISDTFLWLAQAQTLIRLFPRQREKIIIKWTAFALITLDVLFSILNNFVYAGNSRPRSFVDAIPALAYLFQLALSLLYAAWVIYYSITKKRFAFYHPQMRNICLVALLSLVSVLVPVVFFVLDISKPTLAGWGDYVRWVGAAAASVVVWEWVERIEALERDDKKDGVLGREVFDGDEMLDLYSSSDSWGRKSKGSGRGQGGLEAGTSADVSTGSHGIHWPGMAGISSRYRARHTRSDSAGAGRETKGTIQLNLKRLPRPRPPLWPTRPPPTATPISRTDTASAESTVYAIRYHPISEPTPPVMENQRPPSPPRRNSVEVVIPIDQPNHTDTDDSSEKPVVLETMDEDGNASRENEQSNPFRMIPNLNPFRRQRQAPPPEVSAQIAKMPPATNTHSPRSNWDVRARIEDFAATQAEKLREKKRPTADAHPLPVTVIPAPPRRRNLQAALEELENAERTARSPTDISATFVGSPNPLSNIQTITNDTQSLQAPVSQRLSDPYTPNDLNGHAIHQRGALSFVTSNQPDSPAEILSPVSPLTPTGNIRERYSPISVSGSPGLSRTPTFVRRDGLPVISIPAPPRRPRSQES